MRYLTRDHTERRTLTGSSWWKEPFPEKGSATPKAGETSSALSTALRTLTGSRVGA
jgi:hypothetical protein